MPHILVIEDSVLQAQSLRQILEGAGFTVTNAPDGEAGLECLRIAEFDLVLSDVLMPGISGYEVCRQIKTNPGTKDCPVVLLTQLSDPMDILRGLECGADNFITKPYTPDFLIGRLKKILASKERRATLLPDPTVELSFRGRGVTITSDKEQILDLLLATLEEFIRSKEREHEMQVAKEALEKSQQFIQCTLDALTTAVAILDEDGTILATNDAWLRCSDPATWFGASYAVGTNYLATCESASSEEVDKRALAKGIRDVIARACDEFALDYVSNSVPDGSWFNVGITRFANPRPTRVVVAQRDITPRMRLEESLKHKVAELAEANQRTNQFLAMLAHELRNPLVPLHNGLRLMRLADDDASIVARSREMMERQVEHLTRIVNDLLDISRITRGKLCIDLERLDLSRLVRTYTEDNRAAFEKKRLVLEVPNVPVWVRGDSTRLTQVIDNLVQNAIKFTDRDDCITVRLDKDENQHQAVLSVSDTGMGIDVNILPKLFETFVQADHNLDRSRGGLGLGLSMVRSLVELHGGQVHGFSQGPGHGATFTVRLPLELEPEALANAPEPQQPAVSARRCRVLVIEDNCDAADSLQMLLTLAGHEVVVAYSGLEGIGTATEWQPDVILCDIGLPGMDGYRVAETLKKNPITAGARIIAVTGYGQEEDRVRSRESGFDHHLTKPVSPRLLEQLCVPP